MRLRIRRTQGLVRSAVIAVAVISLLAGCSTWLPKGSSTIRSRWQSYEEARDAIEALQPYKTTRQDLRDAGIDPFKTPGITVLTYSDLVQRFAVGSAVRPEDLDRGLLECLRSGKACSAYSIQQKELKKDRTGNFVLDSLAFYRVTDSVGWSFNALIIIVNDTVVYTLYGGQPRIVEQEVTRNPLGPLQSWGDAAGRMLR